MFEKRALGSLMELKVPFTIAHFTPQEGCTNATKTLFLIVFRSICHIRTESYHFNYLLIPFSKGTYFLPLFNMTLM